MSDAISSLRRVAALAIKETLQIVRDRATLGMLLGVPVLQLILFGCAIELTPKKLPVTLVISSDAQVRRVERLLVHVSPGIEIRHVASLDDALAELRRGTTLLAADLSADPRVAYLDASDPVTASFVEHAVERAAASLATAEEPGESAVRIEPLFNPARRTQPFLVSGLLGLILSMTLVMMSALTVARERERGTLDGLLTSAARPAEVWAGKILPYVALAAIQSTLVLIAARLGFGIAVQGSLTLLYGATLVFAIANLSLGFMFSCLARQQMQAMQMSFFFFLPSSLLSGFMFPFIAMPGWAQRIGEVLPLTHFLRIVRGIMLRGVDASFVRRELLPIAAFALTVTLFSLLAWRRTVRYGGGR